MSPTRRPQPIAPGTITDAREAMRLCSTFVDRPSERTFWEQHAPHLAGLRDDTLEVENARDWTDITIPRRRVRARQRLEWLLESGMLQGDALKACQSLINRPTALRKENG